MGSGLTVAAQPDAASLRSSAATGVWGCSLSVSPDSAGYQANRGFRFDGRFATGRSLASLVSGYRGLGLLFECDAGLGGVSGKSWVQV